MKALLFVLLSSCIYTMPQNIRGMPVGSSPSGGWISQAVVWKKPIDVYISEEVFDFLNEDTSFAMHWWNTILGCRLFVPTVDENNADVIVIKSKNNEKLMAQVSTKRVKKNHRAVIHYINFELKSLRLPTMIHELGHVLGLDHDENKYSVMFHQINKITRKTHLPQKTITILRTFYCH